MAADAPLKDPIEGYSVVAARCSGAFASYSYPGASNSIGRRLANVRKTCALSIWLPQTQRNPLADERSHCLLFVGVLRGDSESTNDGVKVFVSVCAFEPLTDFLFCLDYPRIVNFPADKVLTSFASLRSCLSPGLDP